MRFVRVSKDQGIATVILSRGKVNALNESMIEEISNVFKDLENDQEVKSIILTGDGKFFSFGFDIPELSDYSKDAFLAFVGKFTDLYTLMFMFQKPIVAALNGHTIAGGCVLATACDYRIMVSGKAKISLNEIGFGSSVFAGSVEMLKFLTGSRNAESVLYSGAMYSAEEASQLGLVDQISSQEGLTENANKVAGDFARKDSEAFRSIKAHLRRPVAEEIMKREKEGNREFTDIWYSENTRKRLKDIKIYR
ncbi:MAG: enoyl-CoA hydratase/isomerase family protein [Deltaproteobacteria bacterium]|nr:enoyl-CoA hydratase/isomerase family protein [Deltaproteobacteria bacterium]MBL7203675.1 enoyl-CoA hydratase/isomerase family protein [Desulfobacteraceae bacterium]